MADKKNGTQNYPGSNRFPDDYPKGRPEGKLSDATTKKIADVLHIMLNNK